MKYNLTIIPKENNTPTNWYGGSSAELTTYPENSSFTEKNFLWRLGYAKINIPESNFSKLPGVSRTLMVTSGKMDIEHINHYKKTLSVLESDNFMGDYDTKTYGICSVFNLMTQKNYKGKLIPITLFHNNTNEFSYTASYNEEICAVCLYPISGSFKTSINNSELNVKTGDLLRIDCLECDSSVNFNFTGTSSEPCKLIASIIYK